MTNPIVTIEMENGDIMKAELYPEVAPNTVNNFVSLVKKGYYDGLNFHRVINGFMIQGGAYAAFGKIIEGMDIVNKIAETDTDYSDRPLDEQKMKKVTVDTMGTEYPEPEKA